MLKIFLSGLVFTIINNTVGKQLFDNINASRGSGQAGIAFIIIVEMAWAYGIVALGYFICNAIRDSKLQIEDDKKEESEQRGKERSTNVCPNCGAPLQEGAYFCRRCGAKTEPVEKAEENPDPQPVPEPVEAVDETAAEIPDPEPVEAVDETAAEIPDPEPVKEAPVEPSDPEPVKEAPVEPSDPEPVKEAPVGPSDPEPVKEAPVEPSDPEPVAPPTEEPAVEERLVEEPAAEEAVMEQTPQSAPAPAAAVEREEAVCSVPVEPEPQPEAGEARRVLFCQFCGGVLHPLTGECLNCHAQIDLKHPAAAQPLQSTKTAPDRPVTAPPEPPEQSNSRRGRALRIVGAVVLAISVIANIGLGVTGVLLNNEVDRLRVEEQVFRSYDKALIYANNRGILGYDKTYFNASRSIVYRKLGDSPIAIDVWSGTKPEVRLLDKSVANVSIVGDRYNYKLKVTPQKRGATLATLNYGDNFFSILIVIA